MTRSQPKLDSIRFVQFELLKSYTSIYIYKSSDL